VKPGCRLAVLRSHAVAKDVRQSGQGLFDCANSLHEFRTLPEEFVQFSFRGADDLLNVQVSRLRLSVASVHSGIHETPTL
jgi:hypothetical protein